MRDHRMTEEGAKLAEESFTLNHEAWEILSIIVAEWESDPMSVACFDLRIVAKAKKIVNRKKEISLF